MPHPPPINVKELAKTGIFDEKRFFRLLSEENNYVDPQTVKDFYYGLVRLLTSELKNHGVVRLPELGDMALVKTKDRMGFAGKVRTFITGSYMLKFYPKEAWRNYFKQLEKRSGLEGALDPREKTLGRELHEYGVEE